MESLNIVGYIASDAFGDGFVSHQIQNLTIKNFLITHKKNLLLSWTEYKNQGGVVFKSLLDEKFYQGICFYSIEQLWQIRTVPNALNVLKEKNMWIGFARENIFFDSPKEFKDVSKLFWLKTQVEKIAVP